MSEQGTRGSEGPEPLALTRAVVRYRDSAVVVLDALRRESANLRRAGFLPYVMKLRREDGLVLEAKLWTQDAPRLTDFLNAGLLLFGDVPGSLWWESSTLGA